MQLISYVTDVTPYCQKVVPCARAYVRDSWERSVTSVTGKVKLFWVNRLECDGWLFLPSRTRHESVTDQLCRARMGRHIPGPAGT